ncbi:alpha/beta fold hydrolase [Thalassoglobus sp. JC818]|uniref:alpha/beta fold hydrolase n=1 Tax=Thalassoglobus sp. JC818 TaxID=3232136 RepID=UPI0034593D2F
MKKFLTTLVAISLLISFEKSFAQQRPRLTFEQVLQREDADNDGRVTESEFKGPRRLFERLDRDGDMVLTKDDFTVQLNRNNRPQAAGAPPEGVEVMRDVVFGQGGGRDLTMHIVVPKERVTSPAPVFVWVHGGGWKGGTKEGGVGQVIPLVRKGFVGATIEYRLTGEAPFPAQIEDCKCAIRYLRAHAEQYNIDPERIAVGGSSAGGHLVALMGTSGDVPELEGDGGWPNESSRVQAVVDLYGPTDFKQFVTAKGYEKHNDDGSPESLLLGGGEVLPQTEKIRRVNPITYIDENDPPFLIIHGTNDRTVPLNQSETLHAALQGANVPSKLHVIDGAGHGGPGFSDPAVQQMKLEFLSQLLEVEKDQDNESAQSRSSNQRDSGTRMRDREPAWKMPVVEGTNLYYHTFPSTTVGEDVSYVIYLPPSYDEQPEKKFPVVYWLHGIGGSQQGLPAMSQRMTEAIEAEKMQATIVVYVNGMVRSSFVDSKDGQVPVETVAIQELIPHIDANYRTIATRNGRMIEGFSMGGAGAAKWAFRHPELFGSLSIIDGALHKDPLSGRLANSFQSIYGGDIDYYNDRNPWKLAEAQDDDLNEKLLVRIVTRSAGLGRVNREYKDHLEQLGFTVEFDVIENAPHSPNPLYEGLGDKNWAFYSQAFSGIQANSAAESQSPRVERSQADRQRNIPDGVTLLSNIAYRPGNPAWKLDLAMPESSEQKLRPAIVFVHGGGWRGGDKSRGYFLQGALEYAQKGYVCITINYRLTGEAPFPACLEDSKCAVRWLRAHADKYDVDPNRIGAYGNSAGAHLVSMLGLTGTIDDFDGEGPWQEFSSDVQAVCASATPTDFMNWGRPGGKFRGESSLLVGPDESLDERKRLASPISHVFDDAPPFLLVHGTSDRTVPYSQGASFADALKEAGAKDVELITVEGAGHGVFQDQFTTIGPKMEAFFNRTLMSNEAKFEE